MTRNAPSTITDESSPWQRQYRRIWLVALAIGVAALSLISSPVADGAEWKPWFPARVPRLPGPRYTMIAGPHGAACTCMSGAPGFAGLPVEGRVIGVVDDPLAGYADEVTRLFPSGVPLSERAYVRDLMRARMARQVLDSEFIPVGSPAPPAPTSSPGPFAVPHRPRLQSIEAAVTPVRSQGKADWDALALSVQGFDADGAPVRVQGTARLVLWGLSQQLLLHPDDTLIGDTGNIKQLASWTRSIKHSTPFAASSATPAVAPARFLLPLPALAPEHDTSTFPLGAMQVELLAPGEGTFSTFVGTIPLQQTGPLRDAALLQTGSRFLPGESTAHPRRLAGPVFQQSSSLRPHSRVLSVQP